MISKLYWKLRFWFYGWQVMRRKRMIDRVNAENERLIAQNVELERKLGKR